MTDQQIFDEAKHLLYSPEPVTLIQTIDRIRELRKVAYNEESGSSYDPHNHTADLCRVFRAKADELEADMERRIGWC